jgi:hypothetical protein
MQDDPYADRKKLTFAQAEGVEPLPTQLALGVLSQRLRARLWNPVHLSLKSAEDDAHFVGGGSFLRQPWEVILYRKHVFRDDRMADQFVNSFDLLSADLKENFVLRGGTRSFGVVVATGGMSD